MTTKKSKEEALAARMKKLGIEEDDLVEKFILGSGSGGQKVNKSHTCVYLKHLPSGIEVKCQQERSRALNRYLARKRLCEEMENRLFEKESAAAKEIAKIRKQKKRRSRRTKEKILEEKHQRSSIKKMRAPPSDQE
ncbi:MAG: peptide chain release factor-like protein [Candidatus Algichlamydia australiensis]|nr:peptide chain release factor-like protein [Chlamydiales bacterium]